MHLAPEDTTHLSSPPSYRWLYKYMYMCMPLSIQCNTIIIRRLHVHCTFTCAHVLLKIMNECKWCMPVQAAASSFSFVNVEVWMMLPKGYEDQLQTGDSICTNCSTMCLYMYMYVIVLENDVLLAVAASACIVHHNVYMHMNMYYPLAFWQIQFAAASCNACKLTDTLYMCVIVICILPCIRLKACIFSPTSSVPCVMLQ